MNRPGFDVVVVGGGVAGLAAATRLAEAGARPLVLEASPILGGRARSWLDATTGDVVDNGQHLIMGCYRETLSLLERIGTRDRIEFQERLHVEFADASGKGGTIDCPPLPGALALIAGLAFYKGLSAADRIRLLRVFKDLKKAGAAVEAGEAAKAAKASGSAGLPVDESADSYLRRLGQSSRARRNFWDPLILATLNDRPEVASAGTLRHVLDVALLGGAEAARLGWSKVGLGDLYAPAAAGFLAAQGGAVRTSSPVTGIETKSGAVEIALRSGEACRARAAVIAVPPAALPRLIPEDLARSPELRGLAAFKTSPIVGVNLWLDRSIVEAPFVGLLGTTMQWLFNKGELLGRARARGSYLALVVSGARREVERDADDLVRTALADLRAVFPAARRANLLHSLVVKEREATTSPAVGWDSLRPGPQTSDPKIFLAGDWTATGLPATIESAAASGHRAAEAVLRET